jgi:hypothetical protein
MEIADSTKKYISKIVPLWSGQNCTFCVANAPIQGKEGTQGKGAWNENCLMSIPEDARRSGGWVQPLLVPRELGARCHLSAQISFPYILGKPNMFLCIAVQQELRG